MVFTITAKKTTRVQAAIEALATNPETKWVATIGAEEEKGSEVADCDFSFAGRDLRMIVRRQPTAAGDQLSLDDIDGWRFHAIITNIQTRLRSAADVKHHLLAKKLAPRHAQRGRR